MLTLCVCVPKRILTLSPLFIALRRGSSAEIDAHDINKEETVRKPWQNFDSTFYISFYVTGAWRDRLLLLLLFAYSAEALPEIFSLYPYFITYTLRNRS